MMIMRIFCFNHHATLHDLTLTLLSGIRCYNVKIGIILKVGTKSTTNVCYEVTNEINVAKNNYL